MWQKHMYICMDRIPLESHIARRRQTTNVTTSQVAKWARASWALLFARGCSGCRVWLWVDPLVLLDLPFTSLRVFRLHSGEWSRPHTDNDVNEVPQLLPQKFSSACHVVLQNVPINVSRLQFKHPTPKLTAKKPP